MSSPGIEPGSQPSQGRILSIKLRGHTLRLLGSLGIGGIKNNPIDTGLFYHFQIGFERLSLKKTRNAVYHIFSSALYLANIVR